MELNNALNRQCYDERLLKKLTLVIRSCYTADHYKTVSRWINELYNKTDSDVPRGIRLELFQLSRRIPSVQAPKAYDNFFTL